jgi:HSP20 family molecular chaperone IbpA
VTGWNVSASVIHPLFNMSVGPMEVLLTVDLPYVDQKDIKLRCPTTESLEVYAETSRKITFRDLGVKHRHGEFTCYQALIQFPYQVDEKKIVSKFKRGILEVRLPRRK